jgi:hypothetical protein
LHQSLIGELAPDGALEEHVVANLARFVWRREHLDVLRIAKLTEKLISAIRAKELKLTDDAVWAKATAKVPASTFAFQAANDAVWAKARAKAREELGELSDLAEIGVCEEQLAKEIEVRAKLDEMIDKCLKRLLFLRGLKSMARSAPVARIAHVPAREIPIAAAEEAHAAD